MKRFLRILKFAALGFGALVAIGLIAFAITNARANARLEAQIAELRAAGEPLSLVDLARKPIPPDTNAATYLRRAEDDDEAIEKELSAAYDGESEADQEAIDRGTLTPAMQKAIRSAFEAYPKVLPLVAKAAACPNYDAQLDYKLDAEANGTAAYRD